MVLLDECNIILLSMINGDSLLIFFITVRIIIFIKKVFGSYKEKLRLIFF